MLTLILDSATKNMYIALVEDNKLLYEKYYLGANDHAKHIVSGIELALKDTNKTVKDINKIICGVGPGSYTGVRMAVTVAKMMSHFANIPLYKISTLSLMSSGSEGLVLVQIDARRGNVFGGIFRNGEEVVKESFTSLDELMKNNHDKVVSQDDFTVCPFTVIKNAVVVEEPMLLVPNYLRDTEAERNLCA